VTIEKPINADPHIIVNSPTIGNARLKHEPHFDGSLIGSSGIIVECDRGKKSFILNMKYLIIIRYFHSYYKMTDTLFIVKQSDSAIVPTRAYEGDAGIDLYADQDVVIAPGKRAGVNTGIRIQIPDGCYGRVASRSSVATKRCVDVVAGVIDKNYRGQVVVWLSNCSDESYAISHGDKIAQLVCEKISYPKIECVSDLISETDRGANGFGSSDARRDELLRISAAMLSGFQSPAAPLPKRRPISVYERHEELLRLAADAEYADLMKALDRLSKHELRIKIHDLLIADREVSFPVKRK
jgi:dUTP pyrophosphatase